MYSIHIHTTITAVNPADWDRLADDVYTSYGWLKTVEETFLPPVEHRYFLLWEGDHLIGATVCGIHQPTDKTYTLDDHFLGRFKDFFARFRFSLLPSLVCGPLRAYGHHFILGKSLTAHQRDKAARVLMDAVESEARRRHLSVSFINVLDGESDVQRLLRERGYGRTVHFPLNYIDISWESFEDYKSVMRKRKMAHEINRNRREGVTIRELDDVEPHQDRLYALFQMNNRKYNNKPLIMRKEYFLRCKYNMGGDASVFVAEKKGQIIGAVCLFQRKGIAYLPDVGVDHETAGNDFTYFNLVFYHPIKVAIAMGIQRIYLGILLYRMKARRGCKVMNTYIYYRPRSRLMQNAIGPLLRIHARIKTGFIKRLFPEVSVEV